MAPTVPDSDTFVILASDRNLGMIVWIPNPHGQKHLRKVPEADALRVAKALKRALKARLKGLDRVICDAVDHKKRVATLVALETSEPHATGAPSSTDNPAHPFRHGGGVGV